MATFTNHKHRLIGEDLSEELWDNGGRQKRNGAYIGGGYFRMQRSGGRRPIVNQSVGVPGSDILQYPNAPLRSAYPDRYQFDYTWNGPFPDFGWKAESYGAQAWNRMRPDKPQLSLLNSLHELREVPGLLKPRILKYRDSKAWADYYLAINFGWIPLLNDVRNFVTTTINLRDTLNNMIQNEGKPIRRNISMSDGFTPITGVEVSGSTYDVGVGLVTQVFDGVPTFTDKLFVSTRLWATGEFKYWLPPGPRDWGWRAKQILRIYGAYPSPAVVWNAIPWTWLVDWFTNVGDVLENLDYSIADRLASNYAFVMRHVVQKYTRQTSAKLFTYGGSSVNVNLNSELIFETKERSIIDPFSPSVDFSSMSDYQASILGALGYSRMPSSNGRF